MSQAIYYFFSEKLNFIWIFQLFVVTLQPNLCFSERNT